MGKVSVFGFTNTTESSHTVVPVNLGLVDNYAVTTDTANQASLNNKTAPIDLQEVISFKSEDLVNFKSNAVNIQYPSPVKTGVQYSVQVNDTLSTTDSENPSYRVDEPIQVTVRINHPKSGNITANHVATVVERAISALRRADGSWRFDDLMRGAERPVMN